MTWRAKYFRAGSAVFLGLVLCGCLPDRPVAADEEKEPQFLIGRSRVNSMDFTGAIESFEQALALNPRSAAAHLELGWLHAEKELDPAAAIYHYQKFLDLRPAADNAETIRQHIFRLKQELAKAALPIPPSTEMQRQLEQLTEEKRRLQDEVDRLRQALLQAIPTNRPNNLGRAAVATNAVVNPGAGRVVRSVPPPNLTNARSHRVQAGDTLVSIARRYNVKLEAVLAANPTLNPRRMQVGQAIAIPSR
jgi:tetratricopeptide (TPR) repeat protein